MKENKGITLIALVITIIVMLILAGVTINMIIESGMFTRAKEASFKTEVSRIQEEVKLNNFTIAEDGTKQIKILTYDDLKKQIGENVLNKYWGEGKLQIDRKGNLAYEWKDTWTEENNGSGFTSEQRQWLESLGISSGLGKIDSGVYVEFDEGITITNENGTSTVQNSDMGIAGGGSQTFIAENLNSLTWQVLGEDSNGRIMIMPSTPLKAGTSDGLSLKGAWGYINSVEILNRLCSELYSSNIGEARSITGEDVNKITKVATLYTNNVDGTAKEATTEFNQYIRDFINFVTYEYGREIAKVDNEGFEYIIDKNESIGYRETTNEDVEKENLIIYATEGPMGIGLLGLPNIEEKAYNMIFGEERRLYYLLASNCVCNCEGVIVFFVRDVDNGDVGGSIMFYSNLEEELETFNTPLRPVITLNSNFYVDLDSGTGESDSAYIIKQR